MTQITVAVMVALGSGFAALAAGSTQAKKTVTGAVARRTRTTVLAQAPAPPLVSAVADSSSNDSAAPTAPAPPVSAPAPSYSPPVVVSGGS